MNKEKILKIVIISSLVIILIVVIGLIAYKKIDVENINKNIPNNPNTEKDNSSETEKEKYTGKVTCIKQATAESDDEFYNLREIIVEENMAKEGNSLYKIVFKNKDMYEGFKKNEKPQNPVYDDENLTVIYDNEGKQDLTKENIEYENIITNLENEGYSCSLDK